MIGVSINPTTLTVGQSGRLSNHAATVVGRAVLQSAEGYRWHEYYVKLDDGRMIILVWEAAVWKQFEEFIPKQPITAAEAETLRVGDFALSPGESAQIKYRSNSRVVYSEGKTWDGVRTGSEARYFNAESDKALIVVSWTGNEIEFFRGRRIAQSVVAQAFKLSQPSLLRKLVWSGSGGAATADDDEDQVSPKLAFAIIAATVLICFWPLYRPQSGPAVVDPPPIAAPPSLQLPDRARGVLSGEPLTIRGHRLVEIDEQGTRFKRYEYDLTDDHDGHALLVENLKGNPHEWVLLRPLATPAWLTPTLAATAAEGSPLKLDGQPDAKVERLLLSRPLAGAVLPGLNATVQYGFLARSGDAWILARWTETTVELDQGRSVPEPIVLSAFSGSSKE